MIFFLFSIFCFSSFRPFSCPTCHGQSITLFAYHPLYRSTSFVSLLLLPPSDSSFIYRLPHSYFPGLSCVRIGFLIYSSFISSSLFPPLKLTGYQWFHSPILPLSAWGVYTFGSFPICRLASPRNYTQFTIHHTWYTPSSPYHLEASFLSYTPPCGPVQYPFFTPLPFSFFPDFHSPRGPQLCICFLVIIILYYSLFVFLLSLPGWPCSRPNR